ncbi:MAG: M23 family metallopeptidase [Candidatus Babeliaceae bacterium]|nr:M23 family metallopeptidase [Candidatus Babeliaceae bacterium]
MFFNSRFIYFAFFIIFAIVGYQGYRYFGTHSGPVIEISDMQNGGYYAGDKECLLTVKGDYRIKTLSMWVDDKPLVNKFKINSTHFERVMPILSKVISNGRHTLKIEAQDGSYNRNTTVKEITFTVDNTPLQAAFVKLDTEFKVFQGRTLHVQFQVNKPIKSAVIKALSHSYPCVPEMAKSNIYECFVPISAEEVPNEYLFAIEIEDLVGNTTTLDNKFHVVMYPFKKQQLSVQKEKIQKEAELGLPADLLETALKNMSQASPPEKLWHGVFYIPCDMTGISTEFGTIRTTQDRGKYPHNAIDLLGRPKSVIWACQDGVVVIKERYAHSGLTVGIDHGCGVITLYYHLDSYGKIEVGQKIKKGTPVGTLGMTGYASGYHLHWEMRIYDIQVDPMQWTKHDF